MLTSSRPLVSIVIPCWNADDAVGDAIESALAQTYPNVETIVIDDGSTDSSLDIIRSFGARVRSEGGPNRGACAARNRGIELATGDFVQFLDADDLLHPDKLRIMVPEALRRADQIVYSDWEVQPSLAGPKIRRALRDEEADPVIRLLGSPLQTAAPLHRRSWVCSAGGFKESLPCSQERDFHLRLACAGTGFRRLDRILVTTRQRPNSLSSNYLRVIEQHEGIFKDAWQRLLTAGDLSDARALAFSRAMAHDARRFVDSGDIRMARRYFQIANDMHPEGIRDTYMGPSRVLHDLLGCYRAQKVIGLKQRLFPRNAPAQHRI